METSIKTNTGSKANSLDTANYWDENDNPTANYTAQQWAVEDILGNSFRDYVSEKWRGGKNPLPRLRGFGVDVKVHPYSSLPRDPLWVQIDHSYVVFARIEDAKMAALLDF